MHNADAQVSCETHLVLTRADGTVIDLGKVDAQYRNADHLLQKLLEFVSRSQKEDKQ